MIPSVSPCSSSSSTAGNDSLRSFSSAMPGSRPSTRYPRSERTSQLRLARSSRTSWNRGPAKAGSSWASSGRSAFSTSIAAILSPVRARAGCRACPTPRGPEPATPAHYDDLSRYASGGQDVGADPGAQRPGHDDGAVGLLVLLHYRRKQAAGRQSRRVQRVDVGGRLALLGPVPDVGAAGLIVTRPRRG